MIEKFRLVVGDYNNNSLTISYLSSPDSGSYVKIYTINGEINVPVDTMQKIFDSMKGAGILT